jgi:membrane-bound metal-dependent hydrolase YbcI (DUF457 family)
MLLVRRRTHYVFSTGVTAFIIGISPALLAGIVSAIATDWCIDEFGHKGYGPYVHRTPLTHSIITAPLIGLTIGLVVGTFALLIHPASLLGGIIGGVAASACHLFADSFTMSGIFAPRWIMVNKK